MAVPLLDLAAQHRDITPQLRAAFERVLAESQFVVPAPVIGEFESQLAKYCGAKHAVALSSGTDAILAALMALKIGPGDEVIVPPFTFFATAGCVARLGARPVFVDIDPATFNIDPRKIEKAITGKTKAIMPVHLYGRCADMPAIMEIARRHKLAVIEDAAQAIGARSAEKQAGTIGDIGCLSFYPTKNLAALGDGGACLTHSDELAQKLRVLRNHGLTGEYEHTIVGGNFRLDGLQAAFLSVKLTQLNAWTASRGRLASRYAELLDGLPIVLPNPAPNASATGSADSPSHVYHQYTIRVPDGRRDALRAHLKDRSIGHRVYYPLPLHLQPCFAHLGHQRGDFPESERAALEVLSLPIYPELTPARQEEVARALGEFFS